MDIFKYDPCVKQIKVTHDFYDYLTAKHRDNIYVVNEDNFPTYLMGIPIIVDDTINDPYELIY